MTVTPTFEIDIADWPELAPTFGIAVAKAAELMQVHGIQSVRRYRKTGVAGRPYVKDAVVPVDAKIPDTLDTIRDDVGRVILDYVELLGMSGVAMSLDEDDTAKLNEYWAKYGSTEDAEPRRQYEDVDLTPIPADGDTDDEHGSEDAGD